MTSNDEVTFGLVHGAWHGAWCWEALQEELNDLGYRSVAMDLPIDDPDATYEDYADTVIDALADEEAIVLVGHSRSGNVTPRVAGRLAVRKLIHLCASFDAVTIGHPTKDEEANVPQRFSDEFSQGIIFIDETMTLFDKDLAKKLFFSDCRTDVQDWAAANLRPQRRSTDEPPLERWPDHIPQTYILCESDLVIRPEWSDYAAHNWLGVEPIKFPGGHSPFLSRPRQLALLLKSLVAQ